jgi:hypothetical protein
LLFFVRAGTRVPAQFEGLRLTRIGVAVSGSPGEVRLDGKPLEARGFDHFSPVK